MADARNIQDARNFMRLFRSAISFAELGDEIGTWESALNDAKQQHVDATKEAEKQKAVLADLIEQKKTALADVEYAKKDAAKILADATAQAAATAAQAETDATATRAEADADVAAERQKLGDIRQDIGRLEKQRDIALAEYEEAKGALAKLTERFAHG